MYCLTNYEYSLRKAKVKRALFLSVMAAVLTAACVISGGCSFFSREHEEPTEQTEAKIIHIDIDPAGGSFPDNVDNLDYIEYSEGETVKIPTPSKEGYYFAGWQPDPAEVSEDTVVTAVWEQRTCRVVFDLAGGGLNSEETLVFDVAYGSVPAISDPQRDGYKFAGWTPEPGEVREDCRFKAEWEIIPLDREEIYEKASACTVELHTYDKTDMELSLGSGFLISPDGLVATAAHVIEGASMIRVRLKSGRNYYVTEVVSCDFTKDIAILKIDAKGDLDYLELSRDTADAGDKVYAIGSPSGRTGEMTDGEIIRFSEIYNDDGLIVFSAPIESGSSGGPLLDSRGRVIGINIAISVLNSEYLAVRIAEIDTLQEERLSMADYLDKYEGEGEFLYESEPNGSKENAMFMTNGNVCRSAIAYAEDADVYKTVGTKKTIFGVSVELKYSDYVNVEGFTGDGYGSVSSGISHGITGKYLITYVTIVSASPADKYVRVSYSGDPGVPVPYSVQAIVKE